jgi:hypothetical protein
VKTRCVDRTGRELAIYPYEMKTVQIGADFAVGQEMHVVLMVNRHEDDDLVEIVLVKKPKP